MNTRRRIKQQSGKTPSMKEEKDKVEMKGSNSIAASKTTKYQEVSCRGKKMALQQDVDKLKRKLRHEENIHRALERAFTRPLGTLPRLPPCLPPAMLELLAEVAVLEEETVRLEELVVHLRQRLYQEAVYTSTSRSNMENIANLRSPATAESRKTKQFDCKAQPAGRSMTSAVRHPLHQSEDRRRKENQMFASSVKRNKGHRPQTISNPVKRLPVETKAETHLESEKLQTQVKVASLENKEAGSPIALDARQPSDDSPNIVSESVVKCLSSILLKKRSIKSKSTGELSPSISRLTSQDCSSQTESGDPYGICSKFGKRDIGPYKHLCSIERSSINPNSKANSLILTHRLKFLLGKLASVNLQGLCHQEKLAFWINIYNSCMLNAFLEHGIPERPEMVVELMQKATINVGGHLLNPITIEHFILRLPYHSKYSSPRGTENREMTVRSIFGLELSEPLITFALSCGSWSSPAVRVYTASQVENELEVAKREYLRAAVGISAKMFAIPKLLDWCLLDFAKDFDSLLDWICLQLPSDLAKQAIKCLEMGKAEPNSQLVQVMPYEFRFRYLLCT